MTIPQASGVKRYRPNKIASDWFDFVRLARKSNSQQHRFCSIVETNRTPIVRLSSIELLFDFVRLDTPGILDEPSWMNS